MRSDDGWVASFSCPLAQRILQQFLCVTLWWPRHCVWGGLTVFYGVLCCAVQVGQQPQPCVRDAV
jgi:hypothetical protein